MSVVWKRMLNASNKVMLLVVAVIPQDEFGGEQARERKKIEPETHRVKETLKQHCQNRDTPHYRIDSGELMHCSALKRTKFIPCKGVCVLFFWCVLCVSC